MEVVSYGPQAWFFLKDSDGYLLSVRCQQSFVEFETLVRLTPEEYREYHALGTVYINYLAARVSYWAQDYQPRNLDNQLGNVVHQAIMAWKASMPSADAV